MEKTLYSEYQKNTLKQWGSAFVLLFFLPLFAHAQAAWCSGGDCTFKQFVKYATGVILKPIIPLLVSITVVYFLWGVYLYIGLAGDASKRDEGRKKMLMGIIALSVMVSFWGLAKLLSGTFF